MLTIRRSTYGDLPRLMELYREGREIQLSIGDLYQWKEGYPDESTVRSDIDCGVGYVVEDGWTVVGAFACIPGEDPTYRIIEGGRWADEEQPYLTIHRLVGTKGHHGIALACFDWCAEQLDNIRIDTHEDNSIMRHCLEKAGFTYCGIIHLANGDPRIAFQRTARH